MTQRLRKAIENVIGLTNDSEVLKELQSAYVEDRKSMTVTMERIEFLEERLQEGMNKRAAARALVEHDPRIGRRTAETLVYTSFSGMYQNPRKKRTPRTEMGMSKVTKVEVFSVNAEEDLL